MTRLSNYPPGVDGTEPQIAGWDDEEEAVMAKGLGLPYEIDSPEQMMHMMVQTSQPQAGVLVVAFTEADRVFVGYHPAETVDTKVRSLRAQRQLMFQTVNAVTGGLIA